MIIHEETEQLILKLLTESGLDNSYNAVGETKFTKTDGSEFYIQHIIQEYADTKKIPFPVAQSYFQQMMDKSIESMKPSLTINATMIDNVAESTAFNLLEEIETDTVEFSKRTFNELFQALKSDVPEFYPLSNMFEPKRIEPKIFFSPDPLYPEFNGVDTAACSPTAQLIFNVPFMKKLIKFAEVKGIVADPTKGHSSKYESQGGPIPDSYQYLEFLILHEIMHYANGDFFYEKALDLQGKLVNYVGDFVTNYSLVKSGYAQLPMGLFNDAINYDRQNSYQEMYDIVKAEMDKLSDQQKNDMQDEMDNQADDMPADGEGQDPNEKQKQQQKQQQKQDGDSQDGDSQDGSGSGDDKEKTPEEKKKDAEAAKQRAEDQKKKDEIFKKIDESHKTNQKKQAAAASKDKPKKADMPSMSDIMQDIESGGNNGGELSADGNPYELPEKKYTPKMNWKKLLKKMIPSGTVHDETYVKPSRRTTSSMVTVAQTGVGVVKPGTKENPSDKRGLCFVLDESGSTMDKIGEMKQSIIKLIEKNAKDLNGEMYFMKFSNDVHFFKIDLKKKKYGRIVNYNEFITKGRIDVKCTKNMADLFKSSYGGGTNFDSNIANIVLKLKTKLNFNTIIFSDTDIAYGQNAKTLKSVYKQLGPKAFALIGCDHNDYVAFAKLLGDKNNITHF